MLDILEVHDRLNKILPGTTAMLSIDTHTDCPLVRLSVRYEDRFNIHQATELCSSQAWPYWTLDHVESWFRRMFGDLL